MAVLVSMVPGQAQLITQSDLLEYLDWQEKRRLADAKCRELVQRLTAAATGDVPVQAGPLGIRVEEELIGDGLCLRVRVVRR